MKQGGNKRVDPVPMDSSDLITGWDVSPHAKPPKKAVSNSVRTAKYTLVTFLPLNLYMQFHRISNWYFLILAALNFIPAIQAFGAFIAWIPLFFVLFVTAVKDAYEDSRRRASDREINAKLATVIDSSGKTLEKPWKKLVVGDIVQVKAGEPISADMLLLHSSEPSGLAFVDTAELDGETNLKARYAYDTQKPRFDMSDYSRLRVRCEQPNVKIYEFTGVANNGNGDVIATSDNLLLRGCVLRNTTSVHGLVLYTGAQSKVMLNNSGPKLKRSSLERQMNGGIILCLCLLVIMCVVASVGNYVMNKDADLDKIIFLPFMFESEDENLATNSVIRFFTWLVVLQAIVPLSLYVTIEVVKLFQVFLINADLELYDEVRDTPMQCRALNISEDLGQIEYVFSDKTGTLTQNVMTFRSCIIGGVNYPHGFKGLIDADTNAESAVGAEIHVDSMMTSALSLCSTTDKLVEPTPHSFLVCMALCNTVRPDLRDDLKDKVQSSRTWSYGEITFESESPDEVALVTAAASYNYTLVDADAVASTKTLNVGGRARTYEVLATLDFDSNRKRMSQIVRTDFQQILVLCKGADEAIFAQLAPQNETKIVNETRVRIDEYARMGLRTLCFAFRELDSATFTAWLSRWNATRSTLAVDKKEKLASLMKEIEVNMTLLGATGVEDALQVGVPKTIENLRGGGINIWVLTGDKQETAIQIANTCRLFTAEMQLLYLNSELALKRVDNLEGSARDIHRQQCLTDVQNVLTKLKTESTLRGEGGWPVGTQCAMVVDGATLAYCLQPSNKQAFVELAVSCATVVCCRSTPMQKAQLVTAVRNHCSAMTLAIGDGANDASMIQTAHVGIGISGREGRQAVMASDFAISQFRFLERLLFVHGHWSYDRMANLILYFFWKNMMANSLLWIFGFYSWYSGQVSMPQLEVLLYYMFFTSLPPVATATLDQNVSDRSLIRNPALYSYGRCNMGYSYKHAAVYIIDALINAALIFFVAYGLFSGSPGSLLQFGTLEMTCTVTVGNLWIFIETRTHTWINHVTQILMLVFYVGFTATVDAIEDTGLVPDPYGLFQHVWGSGWYWSGVAFVTITCGAWRIFLRMLKQFYFPTMLELVREYELKAIQDNWMERNCGVFRHCCARCCPGGRALHPDNPYARNVLK